jgi:predicted transcriptional regulator of viral defense system
MNYEKLIDLFGSRPFFESGEVFIVFGEPRPQVEARLSRWVSNGKLVKLRHKKYLLPEKYRRSEPAPGYISNYLYGPSYVSLRTALSIYGMIPESVYIYEAVTTKKTAKWDTPIGVFKYYSVNGKRFWGYKIYPEPKSINPQEVFMLAEPEKVFLDLFYFMKGEWTPERIGEMRFQNLSNVKKEKLLEYSNKFSSPKVERGIKNLIEIYSKEIK